MLLKKEL